MAERGTPDLNFESGPVHSGIGSKIGYRHHQPRRPAFIPDAKENPATSQGVNGKKMALRLRAEDQDEPRSIRIFTDFEKNFDQIRVYPRKSVANLYLLCGRLAGGMMEFIRRYSTIWP